MDADFDTGWITRMAEARELDPLDAPTIDAILALAGEAAHDTGDRRNAPLACFLAGLGIGLSDVPVTPENVRK